MVPMPFKLTAEERQLLRDIVAGLKGDERHRESTRVRSILCRLNPECRAADNAKKAAHGRATYHADIEARSTQGRREVATAGGAALRTLSPPAPSCEADEAERREDEARGLGNRRQKKCMKLTADCA